MSSQESTVIASYVKTFLKALADMSVDYKDCMPVSWKNLNTDTRVPLSQVNHFWHLLFNKTQRHDLGLQLAMHIHTSSFHVLGQLAHQCETLAQAWEMVIKYYGLVSEAGVLTPIYDKKNLILTFTPHNIEPAMTIQQLEAMMGSLVRYSRLVMDGDFVIERAEFSHRAQASENKYYRVFVAPVLFDCPHNRLVISRTQLQKKIPLASEVLKVHQLAAVREADYLRERQRSSSGELQFQLYSYLKSHLPGTLPALEDCAIYLHMSASSLKRKLKLQGTSYSEIVMQLRKTLICQLLERGDVSMTVIAYQAGFKNTATFYRSFKQWTGQTPSQYRQRVTSPQS